MTKIAAHFAAAGLVAAVVCLPAEIAFAAAPRMDPNCLKANQIDGKARNCSLDMPADPGLLAKTGSEISVGQKAYLMTADGTTVCGLVVTANGASARCFTGSGMSASCASGRACGPHPGPWQYPAIINRADIRAYKGEFRVGSQFICEFGTAGVTCAETYRPKNNFIIY
ncbi:hypothetical protein [Phenylobacterium sp.]|uniref:hypothetical protein n=1 Tax=Phenylobacterium sp. TaxID=1871053 RepID=UPI0035B0FE8F